MRSFLLLLFVGLPLLTEASWAESPDRADAGARIDRQWGEFLNGPTAKPDATKLPADPSAPQSPSGVVAVEKYISPNATFVLFKPRDWKVAESGNAELRNVTVTDPSGQLAVNIIHGAVADDLPGEMLAGICLRNLAAAGSNLSVSDAWHKQDRYALTVTYTNARQVAREQHIWTNIQDGNILIIAADTPPGQFKPNRGTLLSIANNFRPLKDVSPRRSPLTPQRLRDGSATLGLPEGWNLNDMGKGCFVATGPGGNGVFMSAAVQVLDPRWAGNVRNVPVARYTTAGEAFKMLVVGAGLADEMTLVEVKRRDDLVREARQFARGPVSVEEIQWVSRKGQKRSRGFTMGIALGSEVGVNWSLVHITIASPDSEFVANLPTMAAMFVSFRVDKQWADGYVREGKKRLQEMQRQTSEVIHRNAQEIREINTAIHENKSRSQDYLSHAWSQAIRGESDWISSVEGGTVYRSDSWGLTNTSNGDFYEGKNWDYTHFEGQNPRYTEQMEQVSGREMYEKYVRRIPPQ